MLPPYLADRLETLRSEFDDKAFTVEEARRVLRVSKPLLYTVLHELSEKELIRRVGRGVYIATPVERAEPEIHLTGPAGEIASTLRSEGIRFIVTGLDVLLPFIHHLPVRYPHLIHVEKGSGGWARSVLTESGVKALLDPDGEAFSTGVDLAGDSELAVIRETSNFYAVSGDTASVERALVDLYFETTREGYPLPISEFARILYNTLRRASINYSRLLRYAWRRRIAPEVRLLLKHLSRHVYIPDVFLAGRTKRNEHTEAIREALEGIAR